MYQFYEAKWRFSAMISVYEIKYPLTFSDWIKLPDDVQAIALYVNFFDQVHLACQKVISIGSFVLQEDALHETMKALIKNTKILHEYPTRYTPQYIYKIVYNSVYSLLRIKRDRNFMSSVVSFNNDGDRDDLDIVDILTSDNDDIVKKLYAEKMWDEIGKMDNDTLKYVDYILNGGYFSKKLSKKESTMKDMLRSRLAKYCELFLHRTTHFTDICFDPDIESITVQLMDGTKAVYFGEMITSSSGNTTFILMGAEMDHYVPIQDADALKILKIDRI